jgi:hypothetical protein
VAGALLVVGFLSLFPALGARASLMEARTEMLAGRASLLKGDAAAARKSFTEARADLLRARGQVGNPLVRFVGFLPLAGRSPDATSALVEAGILVADAGRSIADSLEALPAGAPALAPRNGRIPLAPLRALAPGLARAHRALDEAATIIERAPHTWLVGPVGDALREFQPLLEEANHGIAAAAALTENLPAFLGGEGTRRYFVAAQNPAELRGTGGLIGSYSILTAKNGALRFSEFNPINALQDVPIGRVRPPNRDYALRYDQFSSRGNWSNINVTPDFPSAAVAMERLYEETEGVRLEGTIAADPFAFAALLDVAGSVEIPATGAELDAGNVVDYVTNRAYSELPDRDRKELLGSAAEVIFERFLGQGAVTPVPPSQREATRRERRAAEGTEEGDRGEAGPQARPGRRVKGAALVPAARALVETAADGHLLFHAVDPRVQGAFETAGVTGAMEEGAGDYLAVVANNAAGNKADFYLKEDITYRIELGANGSAAAEAAVRFRNSAPSLGQPSYVIGPHPHTDLRAGDNFTYISTYCARTCLLDGFRRDRRPDQVGSQIELDHPVYPTTVLLPSGGSQVLEYSWGIDQAWDGSGGRGAYRLVIRGQPMVHPTHVRVDLRVPEGMHVTEATPGVSVEGGRVIWEGRPSDDVVLEVAFQRPFLARVWHSILDFFAQPVIHLG